MIRALLLLVLLVTERAPLLAQAPPATPTFDKDVAPLVEQNCVPCHRPEGGGPFSLRTYEDVRRHARQIADVTRRRYMPPWLPDAPADAFVDERRLSTDKIDTLARWVDAGCPRGDDASIERTLAGAGEPAREWQLGPPDLILVAQRPLTLPAGGPDVFWNFLYPNPGKAIRYVRAIEIRPGQARLVHHANLLVDRTGHTRQRERSPGAGFGGMDLEINRNPLDPESHFLFWKPGSKPYSEPDGFSWTLLPGNILVLNTHLQPSGKQEQVAPSIGLYFTDVPPENFPILVELQNDRALQIPAGARAFTVQDQLTLPIATRLLAIYPHAHYLGSRLEGTATLPEGTERELIRIPHWDLAQQAVYRYRTPILLPAGTVVRMRFQYDNSAANPRNPHSPPRSVHAGNGAAEEMGHLWLQLLPEGEGDHRRSIQEAVVRHAIAREPQDPASYISLGALQLSRLNAQGAITSLRTAIRLNPKRAQAHDMLGAALQNTGQLQPAIEEFRRALAVQPDYMSAHYNLAVALLRAGEAREALTHLTQVAKAYPDDNRLQTEYHALEARLAAASPQPLH